MTTTPADNPCTCRACGVLILANVTDMCEDCQTDMNRHYDEQAERERKGREYDQEAYANNQAFIAACDAMTPEDWDADNDWLASAGWGEM